jgi:hypothetical protein
VHFQVKKTPQDVWTEVVAGAAEDIANADPAIKKYLPRLAELNNTPRKEAKFRNFIKNSLKLWDEVMITKLWKFLDGRWVEATGRSRTAEQPKSKPAEPDSDSDDATATKSAKIMRDATAKAPAKEDDSDDEPPAKKHAAKPTTKAASPAAGACSKMASPAAEAKPSKKRAVEKEDADDVAPIRPAKKAKGAEAEAEAGDEETAAPELPKWKKTIRRALKALDENASLADLRSAYVELCTDQLGASWEKAATDNFNQRLLEATVAVGEGAITVNLL